MEVLELLDAAQQVLREVEEAVVVVGVEDVGVEDAAVNCRVSQEAVRK